jgi:hypothetical protein
MCAVAVTASGAEKLQYNRDIRPILSDRCFKCHGPDKGSRKASLRLDIAEEAYAPRKKSGKHAIVPGKPEESLVCTKIFSSDPDDLMPPPESKLALTKQEMETIRKWIAEGAVYQPHWSFIPLPDSISVPTVKNKKWVQNDIDRFVLARLEKEGLKPSAEASKTRWLRRVTYDLTGLPPKPEELDGFLSDKSALAYEKVVDRLLASKSFGERMAVPWLDGARYADSYGYQSDQLCPTWPYRDWVIQAFNRNMPYDRFLKEQLAGDLLPGAGRQEKLATAFNRLHRQTNEGGSIEEEWRMEYVADRVHTFGTTMLALTFECTRCHDHKYDPLTQKDYYSLSAFFNSIDEYGTYNDAAHVPAPSVLLPDEKQEQAMVKTERELKEKRKRLAEERQAAESGFREWLEGNAKLQTQNSNETSTSNLQIRGLVAVFAFDTPTNNHFASTANPTNFSTGLKGNVLVPGRSGQAIRFNGDDEISFTNIVGSLQPWEEYSVVFWLRLPRLLTNAVIFHREEGTDTGFHGTELSLDEGHLRFVIKRFWPGNAIAVRTVETLPRDEWVQFGVSYDGSGRAEGMNLYANGQHLRSDLERNHLTKSPQNGGSGITFGALFRSTGLKDALLDELRVYNRSLAPIEFQQLFEGHALDEALSNKDERLLKEYYLANFADRVKTARDEMRQAVKSYYEARNGVAETSVMEELPESRPAYVLFRGRYDAPKTKDKRVSRATPAMLQHLPADAPKDRLGLAAWLVEPHHPLTARVAVNRFWHMLFGRGIVSTVENFGAQGADPTHPELLDWMARDFVNSGWDVQATLKKIVLSATYRQDSKLRPELKAKDPENLLLARGPSQRLPAEMIRDTALAASGLLDERQGGPPVSPYSPGDLWRESNSMSPAYRQSVGTDLYRRSVYTVWKRTAPMADMTAFDAPSREVCVVKRSVTSTPQQAFVLLNDTQFVEAARVLAEKALQQAKSSDDERVRWIFRRLTAREPDKKESLMLNELLSEQTAEFTREPARAEKLTAVGEHKRDGALELARLAGMTAVAQTVMNLDATVWKR